MKIENVSKFVASQVASVEEQPFDLVNQTTQLKSGVGQRFHLLNGGNNLVPGKEKEKMTVNQLIKDVCDASTEARKAGGNAQFIRLSYKNAGKTITGRVISVPRDGVIVCAINSEISLLGKVSADVEIFNSAYNPNRQVAQPKPETTTAPVEAPKVEAVVDGDTLDLGI
jgi:hypothetical protein